MRYQQNAASDVTKLLPRAVRGAALELQDEVERGICEFFSLGECHLLTRAEYTTRGHELVVCCAEGAGLPVAIAALVNAAKAQGFEFMRYHPKNTRSGLALARLAKVDAQPIDDYMIIDLRGRNGR